MHFKCVSQYFELLSAIFEDCGIIYKCDWQQRGRIYVPMSTVDNPSTDGRFDRLVNYGWVYIYENYFKFISPEEIHERLRDGPVKDQLTEILSRDISPTEKEDAFLTLVFLLFIRLLILILLKLTNIENEKPIFTSFKLSRNAL